MDISNVVVSLAGHDKDKLFFVVRTEGEYAYIVNGKGRRMAAPKRKKKKHLKVLGDSNSRTAEKIRSGDKVLDSEIRRVLSEYEHNGQIPGGNETWQKTM